MDALVRGLALVLVLCPTLNTGVVTAHSGPAACADPDVQTLIDVQNSCTSANSSCNIMIPVRHSTLYNMMGPRLRESRRLTSLAMRHKFKLPSLWSGSRAIQEWMIPSLDQPNPLISLQTLK